MEGEITCNKKSSPEQGTAVSESKGQSWKEAGGVFGPKDQVRVVQVAGD